MKTEFEYEGRCTVTVHLPSGGHVTHAARAVRRLASYTLRVDSENNQHVYPYLEWVWAEVNMPEGAKRVYNTRNYSRGEQLNTMHECVQADGNHRGCDALVFLQPNGGLRCFTADNHCVVDLEPTQWEQVSGNTVPGGTYINPLYRLPGEQEQEQEQEPKMGKSDLTFRYAQRNQPWEVPYSAQFLACIKSMPLLYSTHAVLHATKAVGKLAAVYETYDHPARMDGSTENAYSKLVARDQETVENQAASLVMVALRLADLHGFDLETVLRRCVEQKNGFGFEHMAKALAAQER